MKAILFLVVLLGLTLQNDELIEVQYLLYFIYSLD